MEIIILGSSNAVPVECADNTHFIVTQGEYAVLVDTASSPLVQIPKSGIPFDRIEDIILTHFHPDHVSGGPLLLMGLWILGRKKRLRLHGLGYTLERFRTLMGLFEADRWPDLYPLEYNDLTGVENEAVLEKTGLSVFSSPVNHMIPNIGLRFEADDKSFAYSSDTSPTDTLVRLAKGCDLLIHEASGNTLGHSSAAQAAQAAKQAGVKSLLLIHYPVKASGNDDLLAEASAIFKGDISLAKDFMKITL